MMGEKCLMSQEKVDFLLFLLLSAGEAVRLCNAPLCLDQAPAR